MIHAALCLHDVVPCVSMAVGKADHASGLVGGCPPGRSFHENLNRVSSHREEACTVNSAFFTVPLGLP